MSEASGEEKGINTGGGVCRMVFLEANRTIPDKISPQRGDGPFIERFPVAFSRQPARPPAAQADCSGNVQMIELSMELPSLPPSSSPGSTLDDFQAAQLTD